MTTIRAFLAWLRRVFIPAPVTTVPIGATSVVRHQIIRTVDGVRYSVYDGTDAGTAAEAFRSVRDLRGAGTMVYLLDGAERDHYPKAG